MFALVRRIFALDFEVPLVVLAAEPLATSTPLTLGVHEEVLVDSEDVDDGGVPLLSVAHCSSNPGMLSVGVGGLGIWDVDHGCCVHVGAVSDLDLVVAATPSSGDRSGDPGKSDVR